MLNPRAEISLNHLRNNYNYIQSKVKDVKIMAVVKANAYGHGIVEVSKLLSQEGVHGFCVALTQEVRELIDSQIKNPILHLGRISSSELDIYESGQVRCTINSFEDIKLISDYAYKKNISVISHLKVDTGMGRLGVNIDEFNKVLDQIKSCNNIHIEGVFSHFSTSEEEDIQYRDHQIDQFRKVVLKVKEVMPSVKYFHIANSAAILTCSEAWFNMVRPGISIYGVSPLGVPHEGLLPVMKMKAPISLLKNIKKDFPVGYGRRYVAKKDEKIFIVQAGYADGIPTEFSNKGKIEINNMLYSIIGKVSMDLIAVLDHVGKVNIEQDVVFWGSDSLRLEVLSKQYNKIPYEFLTGVSKRVKREYVDA